MKPFFMTSWPFTAPIVHCPKYDIVFCQELLIRHLEHLGRHKVKVRGIICFRKCKAIPIVNRLKYGGLPLQRVLTEHITKLFLSAPLIYHTTILQINP